MQVTTRGRAPSPGTAPTRTVALVSSDDDVRFSAARAFDAAPRGWRLEFHHAPPTEADHVVYGPDTESELQPRFDPLSPETLLPPIPRRAAASAIGVVAACGGAGVSTLALHLAAALSRSREVFLIEPPGARSLSIRVGVPDDAAEWQPGESLDVSIPVCGGSRLIRAAELAPALAALQQDGRAGVVDLGCKQSAFEEVVAAGLLRAVVVVVPPARTAAKLTRTFLQSTAELDRIVVSNRTGHGGDMTRDKVSAVIGALVALELPCSPALRAAEDACTLVQQPWSRWWRLVSRVARSLESLCLEAPCPR